MRRQTCLQALFGACLAPSSSEIASPPNGPMGKQNTTSRHLREVGDRAGKQKSGVPPPFCTAVKRMLKKRRTSTIWSCPPPFQDSKKKRPRFSGFFSAGNQHAESWRTFGGGGSAASPGAFFLRKARATSSLEWLGPPDSRGSNKGTNCSLFWGTLPQEGVRKSTTGGPRWGYLRHFKGGRAVRHGNLESKEHADSPTAGDAKGKKHDATSILGVDSPFFSTIVLFKTLLVSSKWESTPGNIKSSNFVCA